MKLSILFLILLMFTTAWAKPIYYNQLLSFYSDSPEVSTRRCQNCHSKSSLKLNTYGKDFASLKNDFENFADAITALEQLDSDQDGISNGEEILAGTDPSK